MSDQKPFRIEMFAPRIGDTFSIHADEPPPLEAALVSVQAYNESGSQFSIVFRGPPAPVLPQGTYRIENPALGRLDIFIVPIGPDETGMRYEAVFS